MFPIVIKSNVCQYSLYPCSIYCCKTLSTNKDDCVVRLERRIVEKDIGRNNVDRLDTQVTFLHQHVANLSQEVCTTVNITLTTVWVENCVCQIIQIQAHQIGKKTHLVKDLKIIPMSTVAGVQTGNNNVGTKVLSFRYQDTRY